MTHHTERGLRFTPRELAAIAQVRATVPRPPQKRLASPLLLPEFSLSRLDAIHHTDLLTLCNALPSQSVDMILCDLPYGTTACTWDEIIPFAPMWAAFKRVMKPRGAIVLTASQPFTSKLVMSNVGMFRCEWIWEKSSGSTFMNADKFPLKAHESILVFSEVNGSFYPQMTTADKEWNTPGKKNMNIGVYREGIVRRSQPSCQRYPRSVQKFNTVNSAHGYLHPTQKPVALFEYLIRTYTRAGELVLDPCVGSGTTAVAARQTGRRYICGDSSAEYVKVARDRLAQPFTMPMLAMLEAV